mmetsp:Transcript_52681/g.167443  ORF Transcript_52681/g.167443 Transcript_52681/m.167443 type:complete len:383 (+) Transcript_52681:230-1378(+)
MSMHPGISDDALLALAQSTGNFVVHPMNATSDPVQAFWQGAAIQQLQLQQATHQPPTSLGTFAPAVSSPYSKQQAAASLAPQPGLEFLAVDLARQAKANMGGMNGMSSAMAALMAQVKVMQGGMGVGLPGLAAHAPFSSSPPGMGQIEPGGTMTLLGQGGLGQEALAGQMSPEAGLRHMHLEAANEAAAGSSGGAVSRLRRHSGTEIAPYQRRPSRAGQKRPSRSSDGADSALLEDRTKLRRSSAPARRGWEAVLRSAPPQAGASAVVVAAAAAALTTDTASAAPAPTAGSPGAAGRAEAARITPLDALVSEALKGIKSAGAAHQQSGKLMYPPPLKARWGAAWDHRPTGRTPRASDDSTASETFAVTQLRAPSGMNVPDDE